MRKYFLGLVALTQLAPATAGGPVVLGEYAWVPDSVSISSEPPMFNVLTQSPTKPLAHLDAIEKSAIDKLDGVRQWNRGQNRPRKNGISRGLEANAIVWIDAGSSLMDSVSEQPQKNQKGQIMRTADGDLIWSGSVLVESSYRLRLHLRDVDLPEKAEMWVYGAEGEHVGPFGRELIDELGELYTPSVAGPSIGLVVLVPLEVSHVQFALTDVVELFKLDSQGQPDLSQVQASDLSCLEDAQCIPNGTFASIDEAEKSVALIQYTKGSDSFICSGGLINDTVTATLIPYFLTANHCISTQSSASSLEAFWDYRSQSCGGSVPNLGSVPRTNGSTLLATGTVGDFTLLQLNSIPPGRWLMGWDSGQSIIAPGTTLHRISHPDGLVQHYSQTIIDGGSQFCAELPRNAFIYQSQVIGGIVGGSSGSPAMLGNGQIVGQLYGNCGENVDDSCDYSDLTVDGSLANYWASVTEFLDPESTEPFDLELTVVDAADGTYAPGQSMLVEVSIENVGGTVSDSYRITFYASTDTSISTTDHNLGYLDRPIISAGSSYQVTVNVQSPPPLPVGNYYIGAILTTADSNPSNNSNYDRTPITIGTASAFHINYGLNGSWKNPATRGQGFFVDVFPDINLMFFAWFTYDTSRPPTSVKANLGEPGHRWLTAFGPYTGNRADLEIEITSGGVFNSATPTPSQEPDGTITVEFKNCKEGTVTFNIPSINGQGTMPITRIAEDNVESCEAINSSLQSLQINSNPPVD